MKKSKLTKLLVLALVAVVALGIGMSAMADEEPDATVVFDNKEDKFTFSPDMPFTSCEVLPEGEEAHATHDYPDLFGDKMKNLMPGDVVEQKISVATTNVGNDTVEIKLLVDPMHNTNKVFNDDGTPKLDDAGEQVINHDGITSVENTDYNTLASALQLKVYKVDASGNKTMLQDSDLTNATDGGVALLKQKGDAKVDLIVEATVPMEFTGEDMEGVIGWVFYATVEEYSAPGPGPGITDPVIPSDPFITDHYAYVIGRDDGLVHPEANITRAEVATIFFRMFTDEVRAQFWKQTNPFDDVFSTNWYNNAVSTMYNAGVVTGYPDGSFKPDGSITRAEFAAMLSRFFDTEYEGEDLFSDIDGHWAADLINNAAQNGLIEGYPDGTYRPDNYITRAEAMTGINRILGRAPNKDRLLSNMITWPDNLDTEKWYYAAVQEATNSHDYDMMGDGTEKWTKLLEVRDWAALEKEWSEANSAKNPGNVVKSSSK